MMKSWEEIRAWRKAQRAELVARRTAMTREEHASCNERITALLLAGFPVSCGMTVGFCWPYKGEFDARFAVRAWRDQ
ncbi:MAG: 5-formyltetrahydrofolate cyclo-ligase, partial [Burkholderiales bacterium]|nr:5-formyltetrahydrofolate cyclo-ligase [Burkholderiales bacterium]